MGYDLFAGNFIGQLTSYTNWTKVTNGVSSTVTTYATTETVNDAITWTKAQNNKPFFLWLAFNAPHAPYHLPPAGLHSYTNLSGTQQDIMMNPKSYFKASLEALDTEIGRLFDSLKVHNQYDNTDFIFIGDNGNTIQTAQIANTDRAKGTIYQYGVHVPFMISGPSVVNPGRVSDALVNTTDLFATILELFGYTDWATQIPANKPVDSKSILPILKNQATAVRPWAFTEIFKMTPDADDGKTMRNTEYKLLRFDDGHEEFYHLTVDPDESNNLLMGTLNADELANYQYLCGEMTTLVSGISFCNPSVDTKDLSATGASIFVYPNPFRAQIYLNSPDDDAQVELINPMGQLVFSGKHIEQQDFSNLAKGSYFLRVMGGNVQVIKINKE